MPIFFENAWESELSSCIDKATLEKIFMTSDDTHDDLQTEVDQDNLPEIYGGTC